MREALYEETLKRIYRVNSCTPLYPVLGMEKGCGTVPTSLVGPQRCEREQWICTRIFLSHKSMARLRRTLPNWNIPWEVLKCSLRCINFSSLKCHEARQQTLCPFPSSSHHSSAPKHRTSHTVQEKRKVLGSTLGSFLPINTLEGKGSGVTKHKEMGAPAPGTHLEGSPEWRSPGSLHWGGSNNWV